MPSLNQETLPCIYFSWSKRRRQHSFTESGFKWTVETLPTFNSFRFHRSCSEDVQARKVGSGPPEERLGRVQARACCGEHSHGEELLRPPDPGQVSEEIKLPWHSSHFGVQYLDHGDREAITFCETLVPQLSVFVQEKESVSHRLCSPHNQRPRERLEKY